MKCTGNYSFLTKICILILSVILISGCMTPLEVVPTMEETPFSSEVDSVKPQITITPTYEIVPTIEPTPTLSPEPTPLPTLSPTPAPTSTPMPTPIPTKTPAVRFATETVNLSEFGEITIKGMPKSEFESTLIQNWEDVNIEGEYEHRELDLREKHSYEYLISFMENLSKHEAVKLKIMGKSTQGRDIYHLELDFPSDKKKEVVMLSGHVHAREMATSLYILKQFSELLEKSESDEYVRSLLERVKFVSIPFVNPDGREIIFNDETSGWKSNANGVDLNKNFPSVNAGQRLWGVKLHPYSTTKPGSEGYPGPYLGSEKETKIMMQWFNLYAPVASYYIDYHQMGRVFFVGENWDLKEREAKKWADAARMNRAFNNGLSGRQHQNIDNGLYYGVNGKGSCTTDYALSVALGMTFSERYGRMIYDYKGQELLLIMFRNLNQFKEYRPLNNKLIILTLEIGLPDSLGYTSTARDSFANEYYSANHDKYLVLLAEMSLGK